MNIITHALVGWCAGSRISRSKSEVAVVAVSSVIPDVDGLGALLDLYRGGEAELFSEYHHKFGHCLPFGFFLAIAVFFIFRKNFRLALWCLLVFHFHLLCDVAGAMGPDGYNWPIYYFYPFSDYGVTWSGQWPINGWQNILFTVALLIDFLYQACRNGFSPLGFVSERADSAFVKTLQHRFKINVASESVSPNE